MNVRRRSLQAPVATLCVTLLMTVTARAAPAADPMIEFVVVRSDTLIGLSRSVLVSPDAWREVARLNHLPDADRIQPGQVLKIPTRLMRSTPADAKLVSAVGDVRIGDAPATGGVMLAEGQSVQTGPESSAVVELADGSRLRLPPSSLAQVAASRQYGERAAAPGGWFAGTMRVLRGSVEVFATKVLRAKPLEVVTPTAVVGVRGTQYRVSVDETHGARTRTEVVDGAVHLATATDSAGIDLRTGFGAATDAAGTVPKASRLLPAPDLSALPERFDRPLVRFAPPGEPTALRVQVASDSGFDKIVRDERVEAGTDVRIAGLDDAQWHLRARRIDAQGIEGFDAARPFVLKARPEPPAYRAPRADAKQSVGEIEFAWAANATAPQVHLQIAEDPAFARIVQDKDALTAPSLRASVGAAGTYFWRLASVRANGDRGPFGDPQRFELRPLPTTPTGGASADGTALVFNWSGRPQDRQQVELARDTAFTELTARDELSSAEWSLPMPSRGGRYYFRYRSVEPDGFTSPYSETLMIDVPQDWGGLWLLLPALLLLL